MGGERQVMGIAGKGLGVAISAIVRDIQFIMIQKKQRK